MILNSGELLPITCTLNLVVPFLDAVSTVILPSAVDILTSSIVISLSVRGESTGFKVYPEPGKVHLAFYVIVAET